MIFAPRFREEDCPNTFRMLHSIEERTGKDIVVTDSSNNWATYVNYLGQSDAVANGYLTQKQFDDLTEITDNNNTLFIFTRHSTYSDFTTRSWRGRSLRVRNVNRYEDALEIPDDIPSPPIPLVIFDRLEDEGIVYVNISLGSAGHQGQWDRLSQEIRDVWTMITDSIVERVGAESMSDEEKRQRAYDRSMQVLDNWANTAVADQIDQAKRQAELSEQEYKSYIEAYERSYLEWSRNIERVVLLSKLDNDQAKQQIREQFDLLWAHPKVKSVKVTKDVYIIDTTELQLMPDHTIPEWTVPLGEFRIKLPISAKSRISAVNLTNPRSGMAHPHIDTSGIPCFGTYQKTLVELVGQHEVFVAFDVFIKYLESVGDDFVSEFAVCWTGESYEEFQARVLLHHLRDALYMSADQAVEYYDVPRNGYTGNSPLTDEELADAGITKSDSDEAVAETTTTEEVAF